MAREKKPTAEQIPVLEDLRRAAALRNESYRHYLSAVNRALQADVEPSVIARYAGISPQAANSTRNRLEATGDDADAPATVDDVLKRAGFSPGPGKEQRPARRRRKTAS
jgi:hypothetical protein